MVDLSDFRLDRIKFKQCTLDALSITLPPCLVKGPRLALRGTAWLEADFFGHNYKWNHSFIFPKASGKSALSG